MGIGLTNIYKTKISDEKLGHICSDPGSTIIIYHKESHLPGDSEKYDEFWSVRYCLYCGNTFIQKSQNSQWQYLDR